MSSAQVLIFLVAFSRSVCYTAGQGNGDDTQIALLQNEVQDLKNLLTVVLKQAKQTEITYLSKMNTMEAQFKAQLTHHADDLKALQEKDSSAMNQISAQQATFKHQSDQIKVLQDKAMEQQSLISAQQATFKHQSDQIKVLQDKATKQQSLKTQLSHHASLIQAQSGLWKELKEEEATLKAKVNMIQNYMRLHETMIQSLKNKETVLSNRQVTLETEVKKQATTLDILVANQTKLKHKQLIAIDNQRNLQNSLNNHTSTLEEHDKAITKNQELQEQVDNRLSTDLSALTSRVFNAEIIQKTQAGAIAAVEFKQNSTETRLSDKIFNLEKQSLVLESNTVKLQQEQGDLAEWAQNHTDDFLSYKRVSQQDMTQVMAKQNNHEMWQWQFNNTVQDLKRKVSTTEARQTLQGSQIKVVQETQNNVDKRFSGDIVTLISQISKLEAQQNNYTQLQENIILSTKKNLNDTKTKLYREINTLEAEQKAQESKLQSLSLKQQTYERNLTQISETAPIIKQITWNSESYTDEGIIKSLSVHKISQSTAIRISYHGNLYVQYSSGGGSCNRWYFTFNGVECKNPATIEAAVRLASSKHPYTSRRHTVISGICYGLPGGDTDIGFHVGECTGYGSAGDAYTGYYNSISRIIVEQI